MKIIVDKVTTPPLHCITAKDVRLVFSSIPETWSQLVSVVRLSSSLQSNVALYNAPDKIFTISSRRHTKEQTLRLILQEMASHALGFKRRTFQTLQARHQSQVDALVAPLMDELLPKISNATRY